MTVSHAISRKLGALALCASVSLAAGEAARAQTIPEAVALAYGPMRELGSGRLRYFGFHVYDARLWSASSPFDPGARFALGLR